MMMVLVPHAAYEVPIEIVENIIENEEPMAIAIPFNDDPPMSGGLFFWGGGSFFLFSSVYYLV